MEKNLSELDLALDTLNYKKDAVKGLLAKNLVEIIQQGYHSDLEALCATIEDGNYTLLEILTVVRQKELLPR
ncbi:hypothetical protein [Vibrio agarivorans]|uniref:Uncharacterized protein n=1 Tax=Vibrio agarivorans TaxID=153622 RepID=A0ABT7Y742_9VIBR|nr:hypothetical protein [Vibrio agarivorans]MDN2483869.1 hypothetical protein [Vibrio agarivorans]